MRWLMVLGLVWGGVALAQEAQTQPSEVAVEVAEVERPRVLLEADPMAYALSGWSVLAGVKLGKLAIKLAAFSLELPAAAVERNPANAGWSVEIPITYGGLVQRYFGDKRGGWFVGGIAAIQNTRFTRGDTPGQEAITNRLMLAGQGGYQWFPSKKVGLYLLPWAGVGAFVPLTGEAQLGSVAYEEAAVSPTAAVHLGYQR